ncbi:MAG: YbjQ family protein [Alphaproteobacteria bacterium]|nr:YbjQ family protein [Alphaproteobacteria bacterium]
MIISTTETVPGYEITEVLGVARGNVIRAKHVGTDFVASLRNFVGGEITEYTKLMAEAREQATDRMLVHAEMLGADGVVGLRFSTAMVMVGSAEILAYGTAVKLRR